MLLGIERSSREKIPALLTTFYYNLHSMNSINITANEGQLVAVVGHVGAGKSSLIGALLGEMNKLQGRVKIKVLGSYVG